MFFAPLIFNLLAILKTSEHTFKTEKTARYFQQGHLNSETQYLWIVLHGYGLHPKHFVKKFEPLHPEKHCVVAPEGLSRFYQKGLGGRVGASWMTSDGRLDDIADNMNYLSQLHERLHSKAPHAKLIVLGFSQGSPTACRWLVNAFQGVAHRLIIWASDIPEDVMTAEGVQKLNALDISIFIGDNDPFISEERKRQFLDLVQQHQVKYTLHEYQGEHRVYPELLSEFVETW